MDFFLFPIVVGKRYSVIMGAVSFGSNFFQEAPIEVKFRMFLAQVSEEALVIIALDAIKAQECIGELVQCVVV